MVASLNLEGPPRLPMVAVISGTTSVQTRGFTLPFQLGETADIHRLEPVDDAMDEDAEDQHG